MDPFDDPDAVARYAENPPRLVPGFSDLQRMALLLLAERAPDEARILVLGAGGGLELKVFAEGRPGWRFDGVDPAPAMLRLAETALGPLMARVRLHEGTVEAAPEGPFDGAACLLVLHFLPEDERRRTLIQVRRRLKPGARFVAAHHSFPQGGAPMAVALCRLRGVLRRRSRAAQGAAATIGARLPVLAPEQDEALLREAGFSDVSLFYAGFTFRGWVATKP